MRTLMLKNAVALGFAGALALGASAASAAPVLSNTAAVKAAAPNPISEARWGWGGWRGGWGGWRRGGWGPGVGFAAGALIGTAIAGSYYAPYGYGYGPYYGYGYAPAPVYAVPYGYYGGPYGYGGWYGRCYTNEGYGRFRACDTGP